MKKESSLTEWANKMAAAKAGWTKRVPRVYNKHHGDYPEDAVYIGRSIFGKFGNPYSHQSISGTIKVATREEAVAAFEIMVEQSPEFAAVIRRELRGKDLLCWCPPLLCHGSILLRVASSPEPA